MYLCFPIFDHFCNLIRETINSAKSSISTIDTKNPKVENSKEDNKLKTIQELDREKLMMCFSGSLVGFKNDNI